MKYFGLNLRRIKMIMKFRPGHYINYKLQG